MLEPIEEISSPDSEASETVPGVCCNCCRAAGTRSSSLGWSLQAARQENQVRSDVPPIAAVMVRMRTANSSDVPVIREAFGASNGKEHPAASNDMVTGSARANFYLGSLSARIPSLWISGVLANRSPAVAFSIKAAATLPLRCASRSRYAGAAEACFALSVQSKVARSCTSERKRQASDHLRGFRA